jgi:ribosomal protein S27E
MLLPPAGTDASAVAGAPVYVRHRPERTLLYQIVEEYLPEFRAHLAQKGVTLPDFVEQEFDAYLACGRLEHGFLRVRCEQCHAEQLVAFSCKKRGFCPSCGARRMAETAALLVDEILPRQPLRQWVLSVPYPLRFLFASRPDVMGRVLAIVHRAIATHLIRKAGFTRRSACTGAVTQVQRFGSALNLNIHWHMLFLDGVYTECADGSLRFHQVAAPTGEELSQLVHRLAQRIGRHLERQGLLQRDVENDYLTEDAFESDALTPLHSASITYRIALGPQQGRKVFTLQTLPACEDDIRSTVGREAGFSLHAGVAARAHERDKVERLCRYVSRPPVAESRLSLTSNGDIRYRLKTPYRDGTTHVIFQPLDFLARLAALVPRPRVNLIRYYGVFAPNSRFRARVTPAGRGKGSAAAGGRLTDAGNERAEGATPAQRMTWAQRLRRVFRIDVETCPRCGGAMKIIASIEDDEVIEKILGHVDAQVQQPKAATLPPSRAPPQLEIDDDWL